MSVMRRSESTCKQVDVNAKKGTNQQPPSQADQIRAQDDSL